MPGGPCRRIPSGHAGAEALEALAVAEKLHHFLELGLRLVEAGDVGPRDLHLRPAYDGCRLGARHEPQRVEQKDDDDPEEHDREPCEERVLEIHLKAYRHGERRAEAGASRRTPSVGCVAEGIVERAVDGRIGLRPEGVRVRHQHDGPPRLVVGPGDAHVPGQVPAVADRRPTRRREGSRGRARTPEPGSSLRAAAPETTRPVTQTIARSASDRPHWRRSLRRTRARPLIHPPCPSGSPLTIPSWIAGR